MAEPTKSGWRFCVQRMGNWTHALIYAFLVTLVFRQFFPNLRPSSSVLILIGFWVAFYFVWKWVFIERPAELNGRPPISGKELRRRKKEFFDSLER
jgi:hypothetical protein